MIHAHLLNPSLWGFFLELCVCQLYNTNPPLKVSAGVFCRAACNIQREEREKKKP